MNRPGPLFLLGALLWLYAPVCLAQDAVAIKIKQVGLGGIHKQDARASLVQVSVRNTTARTISFKLSVAELNLGNEATAVTNTLRLPVELGGNEMRDLDVPLTLVDQQYSVIYAEARDESGRMIGKGARRMPGSTQAQIVAMICGKQEVCDGIRKTILLSGSPDEQTQKSHALNVVQLTEVPSEDWAYAQASLVILAAPAAGLSQEQRDALHLYMIRGGKLVLVDEDLEDEANVLTRKRTEGDVIAESGDSRFLGVYRRKYAASQLHTVADGTFAHFASASGRAFSDFLRPLGFSESTPESLRKQLASGILREMNSSEAAEAKWLEKRLGTSFRFPSFAEILSWMIAYILVGCLVNFVLLRRLGKQELGWITIPVFAILVSTLLYLSSERHRPRTFVVDEMAVYRMDDKSPLAAAVARIRVSAPSRSEVTAQLPNAWTYVSLNRRNPFELDRGSIAFLSEIRLGADWQATFPLRRWSFADLTFESHRRFAGRIYRDSTGHIHNETGVSFGQAMVVDQDDVLMLGYFPDGAVVDLGHVKRFSYLSMTGRGTPGAVEYPGPPFATAQTKEEERYSVVGKEAEREWNAMETSAFSIAEMVRSWPCKGENVFSDTKAVFFGLTERAPVGATLAQQNPEHKSASLVVATFGEWP